jgi:hypothetical protein
MIFVGGLIVLHFIPAALYSETQSYRTDIFTAQNGKETRMKTVSLPKRAISLTYKTRTAQMQETIEEAITYAVKYNCYVPLWFSASVITGKNGSNPKCDITNMDFTVNEYVLIYGINSPRATQISEINGNKIVLTDTVNFSIGEKIVPLLKAAPSEQNAYILHSPRAFTWQLKFKELL